MTPSSTVVHYIGGYYLLLGGADAIVFTGGIGENGITTRRIIINRITYSAASWTTSQQDRGKQVIISKPGSK